MTLLEEKKVRLTTESKTATLDDAAGPFKANDSRVALGRLPTRPCGADLQTVATPLR